VLETLVALEEQQLALVVELVVHQEATATVDLDQFQAAAAAAANKPMVALEVTDK